MRLLFLERLLFNPIDNWLYDFETDWNKKSRFKKIFMFPLILILGDIRRRGKDKKC